MVARRAHNPKVVGSNPAPATTFYVFVTRNSSSGSTHYKQQAKVVGSNPASAEILK